MARELLRRALARVTAGAAVVLASATVLQPAGAPIAHAETGAESEDCSEYVQSEARALALAKACDRAIMVDGELTEFSELVAEPDGRMRLTAHVEPVRARDGSGDWAPIDANLRLRADGTIQPVNTLGPVSISNGGDAPFAKMVRDGKQFGLKWPQALPKPVLAGDTATYSEVLPGVDLTVTATATGFSHNLVVKSREAAQDPRLARLALGVTAVGVTAKSNRAGGVDVVSADGSEPFLAAPQPMMWDSAVAAGDQPTTQPAEESSDVAEVDVEVGSGSLTLVPDAEMLTSSATEFPVVIDPLWTTGKRDGVWATVSEKFPSSAYWKSSHLTNQADFGDAGAGRTCDSWTDFTCHTPSYRMRSYFRMNTEYVSAYKSRVISSATFKLRQEHAWVCQDSSPLSKARIWRTSDFTTNLTWSNQPWWSGDYSTSGEYANYGAACPGGPATVEFDAKTMVQYSQDNSNDFVNIALKAIDESTVAQWKRYDSTTATLNIWFNTRPGVPTGRSADGSGCGSSSSPVWVKHASPYLQGKVTDSDGTVKAQYEIRDSAGALVDSYTSGFVSSGTTHQWTTSKTLYQRTYHWRMRGYDGALYSDWTSYCYFTVDSIAPTVAIERLSSVDDIDDTRSITYRFTGTDANGITKFEYGLDNKAQDNVVTASGNAATVTLSNLTADRHLLYVWSRDPAGHRSAEALDTFFVGDDFPATQVGAWRLDGDALDDSGRDKDLTLGSGTAWGPDRDGTADRALVLPGTTGGCSQTSGAVLQTDKAYSVAAWVKPGAGGGTNPTVLSQAGTNQPGFFLQLERATNRWRFIVPSADTTSPTWTFVTAPTDATEGWTHVAATMDPVAKVMRLFINGDYVASEGLTAPVWSAEGPLLVGCAGRTDGTRSNELAGSVDNVGVWQGLLSEAQIERAMTDLSPVKVGDWTLHGAGTDATGSGNDLTLQGGYGWVEDQYGLTNGAVSLDGAAGSCASTNGPVMRTDDSFSVSAWAKVSDGGGLHPTLVSQAGSETSAFFLGWDRDVNKWTMTMGSQDTVNGGEVWYAARSTQTVAQDKWQHVAGVYDADKKELRLFVNGEPESTVPVTAGVWNATGALHVGCAVLSGGARANWVKGALSAVTAHRGALNGEQVRELYGNPAVAVKAMWPLDGPGTPEPDPALLRDSSENGHDLSIPGSYGWTDDRFLTNPEGSLTLSLVEGSCAKTTGTVVSTNESFTVASWVKADTLPAAGTSTVLSQATSTGSSFRLTYRGGNEWAFEVADGPGSATWHTAAAVVEPDPRWSGWVHVAGIYNRSAIDHQVQLFVNGARQKTAKGPATPWHENGEMLLGCTRLADGTNGAFLGSAVDEVRVWSSTVDPARIEELFNF